jgi:hypothetical protein
MGPALLLGGLIVLSLFVLATALVGITPGPTSRPVTYRYAIPVVVLGTVLVGVMLGVLAHAPPLVVVGLTTYTGVAATAMWRMVQLDRGSRWMEPARRRFRIGISIVAVVWLGIVLGLCLWIAASIASGVG